MVNGAVYVQGLHILHIQGLYIGYIGAGHSKLGCMYIGVVYSIYTGAVYSCI